VPREDADVIVECEKAGLDGMNEGIKITAPKVRSSNATVEKRITSE
jgi:hypothetical protein